MITTYSPIASFVFCFFNYVFWNLSLKYYREALAVKMQRKKSKWYIVFVFSPFTSIFCRLQNKLFWGKLSGFFNALRFNQNGKFSWWRVNLSNLFSQIFTVIFLISLLYTFLFLIINGNLSLLKITFF